ncbi:MAG: O-methyltransferase [Acidimicrobiia bacterium]|nr:O-methyltransferase [Acidimicrobiia bacterium]
MPMTPERWTATNDYAREVFGTEPDHIRATREAAEDAGLPTWAVSSDVGRLLALLTATTRGRLALEIGTLGGYSALWLLEGLRTDARLITIEYEDEHADFAADRFARHGLADRVDLRRGAALELLPDIAEEVGRESVDVVFIDADKESYPDYYELTAPLVAPGGLLLVDNVFGTGSSWIDDFDDEGIRATDRMNRRAAADDRFDTAGVFIRAGLLIARRR